MKFLFYILLFLFFNNVNAQIITTIAGNGIAGFSGDSGQATSAELNIPAGISLDSFNNIYFADNTNNRIRKINPSGIITTIAGNGIAGFSGDGSAATLASINNPLDVVLDRAGNMFIADRGNNRIRKVNATGIITTFAGTGIAGYSGDGGSATAAQLNDPVGIAIDRLGNVYISDDDNNCIRKIDTAGIIRTIAGTGIAGFSGDGGPAITAQLYHPDGITADGAGNIYFSDEFNFRIRKIDTSGTISTIAGTGVNGFGGDGGLAIAAQLSYIIFVAFDSIGNMYIADNGSNHRLRKINTSGIISTFAGTGIAGYSGDGGPATVAELTSPWGLAVDVSGNVYSSDAGINRIRKISNGNHIPSFTGGTTQTFTVCKNALSTTINSLLAVTDLDTGQTEIWTLLSGPYHGTAVASYSTTSTGGILTPTGLSFTPFIGYSGNDTFQVRINDGIFVNTTTIHVIINDCALMVKRISDHEDEKITICPNPNTGIMVITLTSDFAEETRFTITNLMGEKVIEFSGATNKPTPIKLDVPSGVYFISATTSKGIWSDKVLIR